MPFPVKARCQSVQQPGLPVLYIKHRLDAVGSCRLLCMHFWNSPLMHAAGVRNGRPGLLSHTPSVWVTGAAKFGSYV